MYIVHITDKHLEYRLYKYVYNPISATSGPRTPPKPRLIIIVFQLELPLEILQVNFQATCKHAHQGHQ